MRKLTFEAFRGIYRDDKKNSLKRISAGIIHNEDGDEDGFSLHGDGGCPRLANGDGGGR